jgi:hypothetical protein
MPPGRTERVTRSLYSAQALQSEAARARGADRTLAPLSLRGRHGPGRTTRREQFATGGQALPAAQAARAALVSADTKAQDKVVVQRRLRDDYVAWFNGVSSVDPYLRGLQPKGALPACHEAAMEFILQLPTMLREGAIAAIATCLLPSVCANLAWLYGAGVSMSEIRDYMVALNSASKAAGGVAPFSNADLRLDMLQLDVLQRTCGVGHKRIKVSAITPGMFRLAECQIAIRQEDCFELDAYGDVWMKTDPIVADPIERLYIVERTFFSYLATCESGIFNEGQLYQWTVLHCGLSIANRVHSMITMLAGHQVLEPDYDAAYRELVWTTGQPGMTVGAALHGWAPATDAFVPEAVDWLNSPARAAGILSFAFRGRFVLTELKVSTDQMGGQLPHHDLNMEGVALMCRSPALCILVHCCYYRLFVLPPEVILRKLWRGEATPADFRLRLETPLWCTMYATEYTASFMRTSPAGSMAAREAAGVDGGRVGKLTLTLGERTLLGMIRMPFWRAGYLEAVIQFRSFRRACLRTLQIADIIRGGTGCAEGARAVSSLARSP